ncbi:MAG: hypothetical protein WAL80_01705 [Xanthobacteraceae bacterium]
MGQFELWQRKRLIGLLAHLSPVRDGHENPKDGRDARYQRMAEVLFDQKFHRENCCGKRTGANIESYERFKDAH